jgi:hypothetical protein
LWDGGIDVWLGDEVNGYVAEETISTAAEIAPWLQEAIAHFYPTSTYAASLSPEVLERAAARQFLPPWIAARVNCPHWGAECGDWNGGADRIRVLAVRQFGQGSFTQGSVTRRAQLSELDCNAVLSSVAAGPAAELFKKRFATAGSA